jgi:hypothetical protein
MRARFQRAVQRCPARALTSLVERMNFGVRSASAFVRAIAHDDAVIRDDRCANHRIRRGAADSAARLRECAAHPP